MKVPAMPSRTPRVFLDEVKIAHPDEFEMVVSLPKEIIMSLYPGIAEYGRAGEKIFQLVEAGKRAELAGRIPGEDTYWELTKTKGEDTLNMLRASLEKTELAEDAKEVMAELVSVFPTKGDLFSYSITEIVMTLAAAYMLESAEDSPLDPTVLQSVIERGKPFYGQS